MCIGSVLEYFSLNGDFKMILLADVGGTKTVIGLWDNREGLAHIETFSTSDIQDFTQLLITYLKSHEIPHTRIKTLGFAIAAPIGPRKIKLTNAKLIIDQEEIEIKFHPAKIVILNDMEAIGWYIKEKIREDRKSVICNIGTGFGLSLISKNGKDVTVFPSEYGHRSPSFEIEDDVKIIANGLDVRVDVEFFLSGRGMATQFVIELLKYVEKIRDTISKESVTDALLRTYLTNPQTFTKFTFDISELEGVEPLSDTGLKGLTNDDQQLKFEEIYRDLISQLVIIGGIAGPLLQVLGLEQLRKISLGLVEDFIQNLMIEFRNIIFTFLPTDQVFTFGSIANRIDWEGFTQKFKNSIRQEDKQFSKILSSISIQSINQDLAPILGLVNFIVKS